MDFGAGARISPGSRWEGAASAVPVSNPVGSGARRDRIADPEVMFFAHRFGTVLFMERHLCTLIGYSRGNAGAAWVSWGGKVTGILRRDRA